MMIMKKWLILSLFALFSADASLAQQTYATTNPHYVASVEKAFASMKKGQCDSCLINYKRAFAISQKSAMSTLRAAACAYQCGQEAQAKQYIQQAITIDYGISEDVWLDRHDSPEFNGVRSTKMADYVQGEFDRMDSLLGYNRQLKQELLTIYKTDQQPRSQIDSLAKQFGGYDSPEMRRHWASIHVVDSINLAKTERILAQYGYPRRSQVGPKAANTPWLIIQHSPLPVQEKYLPLVEEAARRSDIPKSSLALLIDRIRVYKGQKQLYGSQVSIGATGQKAFDPIEDEANVNKRRAEMDMGTIEEYAKQFGFTYQVPKK